MEALAIARHRSEHDSLIVGHQLRCPRCKSLNELLDYFVFDRPEPYADELNVVLKCRARVEVSPGKFDRCRCIFSIGDPLAAANV
jgi:hypothetical protein